MKRITQTEIEFLEKIDNAITSAFIRVDSVRLRRYLRNWANEIGRKRKSEPPYLLEPRKK